eukprot:3962068-Pyramimonas_sp.AAC.1
MRTLSDGRSLLNAHSGRRMLPADAERLRRGGSEVGVVPPLTRQLDKAGERWRTGLGSSVDAVVRTTPVKR